MRTQASGCLTRATAFPDPTSADSDGCLGVSEGLDADLVVSAYAQGIFPMAEPGGLMGWWSPDPRTVVDFERFHVSRRLRRTLRSGTFELRVDTAFARVIDGCADRDSTWIDARIRAAYTELHRRGLAHSVETWKDGDLVGGLYGVSLRGAFMAESMFHRATDASKVAVVGLVDHLRQRGLTLLDIQYETRATSVFRPHKIPRADYLARLADALDASAAFSAA